MGEKQSKKTSILLQAIAFFTLLLSLALSSPVQPSPPPPPPPPAPEEETSEDPWLMTSEGVGRSHLVMWMMTEKQLLPRVQTLVDSATALLRCACREEGKPGVEECLALGASLPTISGLSEVPSQTVLQSENKKAFVKILLDNGYTSLKELEALLWTKVTPEGMGQCGESRWTQQFMDSLQTAALQYHSMITSFYKSQLSQPAKVQVPREQFSSDRLLAIKVLYEAVNHLNQITSTLEYSVQFSWFSRLGASISGKGRKFRLKMKNRKTKKAQ